MKDVVKVISEVHSKNRDCPLRFITQYHKRLCLLCPLIYATFYYTHVTVPPCHRTIRGCVVTGINCFPFNKVKWSIFEKIIDK